MRWLVLLSVLLLAGCDPTPEDKARVNEKLPAGCVLSDLGPYGDIHRVLVVACTGRIASVTGYTETETKTYDGKHFYEESNPRTSIWIGP
jgi:hypothetical protein